MEDKYKVGDVVKFLKKIQRKRKKKDMIQGGPQLTDLFVNSPCSDNNETFYKNYLLDPPIAKETKASTKKGKQKEVILDEKREKDEEEDLDSKESEDEDEESDIGQQHKSRKKIKTDGTPKDKRTIFVGNIPVKSDKKELMKEFANYGPIKSIRMRSLAPAQQGASKQRVGKTLDINERRENYNAYIVFASMEAAERATEKNGELFNGFHLRVDLTRNEKKNDSKRSVFLGGLPYDINEEDVRRVFDDFGDVEGVRVVRDSATGMGKGFGFIVFKDPASVALALKMNSQSLQGRKIRVKAVEKKVEKRTSSAGSQERPNDRWKRLDSKGRKRMRYKMKLKKRKAHDLATQGKTTPKVTGDKPQQTGTHATSKSAETHSKAHLTDRQKPFNEKTSKKASADNPGKAFGGNKRAFGKKTGGQRQNFGGGRRKQGIQEFTGKKVKFD